MFDNIQMLIDRESFSWTYVNVENIVIETFSTIL